MVAMIIQCLPAAEYVPPCRLAHNSLTGHLHTETYVC